MTLSFCEVVLNARPSLQRRTKLIKLRFQFTVLFQVGWVGVGGVDHCTIRLNSPPLSLSWGLTELGNT